MLIMLYVQDATQRTEQYVAVIEADDNKSFSSTRKNVLEMRVSKYTERLEY